MHCWRTPIPAFMNAIWSDSLILAEIALASCFLPCMSSSMARRPSAESWDLDCFVTHLQNAALLTPISRRIALFAALRSPSARQAASNSESLGPPSHAAIRAPSRMIEIRFIFPAIERRSDSADPPLVALGFHLEARVVAALVIAHRLRVQVERLAAGERHAVDARAARRLARTCATHLLDL